MYSDRRVNGQNPPRTKPSRQNSSWQNPRTEIPENNWERICTGFFVLGLLKIGGPKCVTYFCGAPGMCDKVWQRGGSQNWPKITWRTLWTAPTRFRLTGTHARKINYLSNLFHAEMAVAFQRLYTMRRLSRCVLCFVLHFLSKFTYNIDANLVVIFCLVLIQCRGVPNTSVCHLLQQFAEWHNYAWLKYYNYVN